jgi:hypothetical protein
MRNYNSTGNNANIPPRHSHYYQPDDLVELVVDQPVRRPASMRSAIPYINVPGPDQTWRELNEWRRAFGLSTVVELIG